MAFTQRKLNRLKAWNKYNSTLKKYSRQPIIKNVDIEDLKTKFTTSLEAPKSSKKIVEEVVTTSTLISE